MPTTTLTQNLLWLTNPLVLFLCAFGLYRRGEARVFPGFFIYLIFVGAKAYAVFLVTKHLGLSAFVSFSVSYSLDFISIGLSFVVLYEVVRSVMTSGTLTLSRNNFILLTVGLLVAGALLSGQIQTNSDVRPMKIILTAQNSIRAEQVGLLIIMAIVTFFFGFYWRNLAFGIAAGFGFYSAMNIISIYVRGKLGPNGTHLFNLAITWSYQVASLIWLFYIYKKPKLPLKTLPSDKVSEYTEPIERLFK